MRFLPGGIVKAYGWAVLTLGMAYGATVVFTFFGPVMSRAAGTFAPALGMVAVAFHVLSFYLPLFRLEFRPGYFRFMALVLVPGVLVFHLLPVSGQALVTVLFAWTVGRIGCFWTYDASGVIPPEIRGRIVAWALCIAFFLLYLVNMGIAALSKGQALIIPAVMVGMTLLCHGQMSRAQAPLSPSLSKPGGKEPPYFSFLLMVYIAGGFTYAGIYPYFAPWAQVDRYVNVVSFFILAPLAGWMADTRGVRAAFSVGVVLLGISLAFFLSPCTLTGYLGTQTFLQAGWAFINVFGWSFSWEMAARIGQPYHFARGISAMLLGAALGAFASHLLQAWGIAHQSVYGLLAMVPLFMALVWLFLFPGGLAGDKNGSNTL